MTNCEVFEVGVAPKGCYPFHLNQKLYCVAQNRVKDFRAEGNLWQVDLGHRFHCVEIGK